MKIPWKQCDLIRRLNTLQVPNIPDVRILVNRFLTEPGFYLVVVDQPDGGKSVLLKKKTVDESSEL